MKCKNQNIRTFRLFLFELFFQLASPEFAIAQASGSSCTTPGIYAAPSLDGKIIQCVSGIWVAASTDSLWTTSGTSIYYNTGSVGIGTTSPQAALQVNGSIMLGAGACSSNTAGSIQYSGGAVQYCNGTSWANISSSTWSGAAITVPYGGTGLTNLTSNVIYKGNGTSAMVASGLTDNGTTIFSAENIDVTGYAVAFEIANDATNGTRANKLAKLTSSGNAVTPTVTGDTDGMVGVVVGGAGTSGNAQIATIGLASCVFDGATTAGHYVGISSSVAGDCVDAGATRPATQTLGRVLSTNAAAGTYTIALGVNGSAGSSGGPAAFNFVNQTGVALSSTITSNTITLTGFTGVALGVCYTGCTNIIRNGVSAGLSADFFPGDTIAIQQSSSASNGTTTSAVVAVGGTASGTWQVTTATAVNNFSFANQTGVAAASTITSNTVTLTGGFSSMTATCGAGCTNIIRNGTSCACTTLAGFNSGDTIAIQQTSSTSANTATTATVTVGTVTSSAWQVSTATAVNAFSFTNQTGVALSTAITSNTVTLTGGFSSMTATCGAGCTNIIRNGTSCACTTLAGFNSGDTIAIQQTSSAAYNTATTATVTVGVVTSSTWSVTTTPTASAFSFTNQTGVAFSTAITSNTVTLAGGFSNLTATCGTGCTGISRNGGTFVAGPVSGFNSGDTIAIQQTSSASASTVTTATVTVGGTTSTAWSVTTTNDPCAGSPSIGTVCADGTIYAGLSPDGSVKMYTMPCDLGMTGTHNSCTGTRSTYTWGTYGVSTGYTSQITGKSNTANLIANYGSYNDSYETGVPAAKACATQTFGGHSDWYLPALNEFNVLYTSQATIGGFTSAYYWSSSEYTSNGAWFEYGTGGSQTTTCKANGLGVRCVRR